MQQTFLPRTVYRFFFVLLGLVYITGLFIPLMDTDAAHHANIALHMYLTGDYVSLVDHNGPYLDKPHLLFWLSAFSYKILGVTGFAYKLPSLLFSVLGVFSVFQLGKALYSKEVGRLAALMIATAFAFILANNDVRMEATLTACIAFASWQLVAFIDNKKWGNVAGAALGLALGFSTKGMIAVFVPAIGAFFYILYKKEYTLFFNGKWLILLLLFAVFISPVLYCYYLQFNLHPELMVRGKDHINGVKFILLNQSVERFGGQTGDTAKQDHLFFLHSFLWAFAPWSILVYTAIAKNTKSILQRKSEWLTAASFIIILLLVSFSGFKLPHYLNIIFPVASVIAASFIINLNGNAKWMHITFIIQLVLSVILLLLAGIINAWAFPVHSVGVIIETVILLAAVFYFIRSKIFSSLQKAVLVPVATMLLLFFLLNTNFYPQLLKYQGGNEMAIKTKNKLDPKRVFLWPDNYSSSFNFYTKTLRQEFADSILNSGEKTWLLFDIKDEATILKRYRLGVRFETPDYEITKIDIQFINPEKRESRCSKMIVAEVSRP